VKGRFRVTREEDVDSGEITSVDEDGSTNGKEKKRKRRQRKILPGGAITAHTTRGGKTKSIESRSSRWRKKVKSR